MPGGGWTASDVAHVISKLRFFAGWQSRGLRRSALVKGRDSAMKWRLFDMHGLRYHL